MPKSGVTSWEVCDDSSRGDVEPDNCLGRKCRLGFTLSLASWSKSYSALLHLQGTLLIEEMRSVINKQETQHIWAASEASPSAFMNHK